MKLRRIIREYFTFSKGERIGLTILIVLMIILLIADRLIFYFERPTPADRRQFEELVASLKEEQTRRATSDSLFPFDPNTIGEEALASLALPRRIKQNLLKYRSKGAVIREKEDFRKLYGMNDSLYAAVKPYLLIRGRQVPAAKPASAEKERDNGEKKPVADQTSSREPVEPERMEINSATADDLCRLDGIGDVLSERIVKYRDLLGGFYSLGQLQEVYGLPPETLMNIAAILDLDTTALVKININFARPSELARHPYLEWKDVRRIIAYREKYGFIETPGILLKDSVLQPSIFDKVAPYLQTSGN